VQRGKVRNRRYKLSDAVQAYVKHERESAAEQSSSRNGSSSYELARTARMRALAKIESMRAAEQSGEVISRATVASVFATLATTVRSHVLAIPSRCARLLLGQTDFHAVHSILKDACVGSLREISRFDPDRIPNKKASRAGQNGGVDDE
jgi:phage terminase Nu1 subunit (DNA packaging protein)